MTDTFTSTVDGAAAYERQHSPASYDDRPSLSDLAEDREPQPLGPCATCEGGGEVGTRQDYWGNWETETCRDCHGTGEITAEAFSDAGHATTAGLLLLLIFGGLLFLAVLHVGQQAMCDLHHDGLRYCAGYVATNHEEIP